LTVTFICATALRQSVNLEPVPNIPAMVMEGKERWVCVADLHLGIEVQLRRSGFNIPSQSPKMLDMLLRLAEDGRRLLILGDVKHRIPAVSYREDREIPPFFERLKEVYEEIVVVAGNHDGGLGSILHEGIRTFAGRGTTIEDVGAIHGHVWPSKEAMGARQLIMGHIHPSVLLVDSIGTATNEKCWVRARLKKRQILERYDSCPQELVVVPAFNPLLTGTPINYGERAMLGPLFRNDLVDRRTINAYLLDGTNVGFPTKKPRSRKYARWDKE
jgi:putative SbcD/Mre11-related phosphoesterase